MENIIDKVTLFKIMAIAMLASQLIMGRYAEGFAVLVGILAVVAFNRREFFRQ